MTGLLRPAVLLSLALTGCQQEHANDAPEISDAQAVAAVKAAQNRLPPIQLVALQPIEQADKDRYNLNDLGCELSREADRGAPLVLTNDGRAMVRVDDEVIPLAADVGGTQLGTRAWQHYIGKRFALTVKPASGTALPALGQLELRDAWGRVIFSASGMITCAA